MRYAGRILWTEIIAAERRLRGRPQNGRFMDMQATAPKFTSVLVVRCLSDNRRYALKKAEQ
jgi:hypothetical protein